MDLCITVNTNRRVNNMAGLGKRLGDCSTEIILGQCLLWLIYTEVCAKLFGEGEG